METRERAEFVRTWGGVLFRAERDVDFAGRLRSDPRAVLTEVGMPLRSDAPVVVQVVSPDATELERQTEHQLELYAAGHAGGAYTFLVPG